MARIASFVGVGILAFAPATSGEAPLAAQAKLPSPLLGVVWNDEGLGSSSLVSVDPRSLRPLPGRALSLFGAGAWAYSPSRASLALAGSCQIGQGLSGGIVFVDVAHVRSKGCLWLGGVTAMLWPEPRRLVALTNEVVSIDPVGRRVLGRSPLPLGGQLVGMARAADRLLLLVASEGYGRLIVVDGGGAVRSTALDLPAGMQPREATFLRPGLAIDSARSRAFVIPEAGPVAEVFLDTLAVEYRNLRENISLLGRLAAWLQPTAQAKGFHPSASRTAVWLGNGMLAVAGTRTSEGTPRPTGLMLIDTRTWTVRMLDRGVNGATVSQGRLVATGARTGVAVFDLGGRLLYRRFEGRTAWVSLIHRGRIFASVGSDRHVRVLELASGQQVGRRSAPPPHLLLESSG